jgi:hypothetical protein
MEDEIKLPIDVSNLSDAEYRKLWEGLGKVAPSAPHGNWFSKIAARCGSSVRDVTAV